ncbi:MAG TPA: hypothetical protein VH189_06795 [Rhizomicrobium sp.]|nr:hypothetical protein [Rhizomicrobium sp.]
MPLLCAIAVLWLATRHYFGVVQDARFYTLEALHSANPAAFADDMYFKFGSQGSFSLFTRLYLPFVSHFGVGAAGMAFTIAGQLCWILALYWLARCWVGERYLWLSVATVIAMPGTYSFFGYGEGFATPRLFAEALTMLALALLRSRPIGTLVLLGLAAALHPLMALPGMVAVFVYFALARPVLWLAVPAGIGLGCALGWAEIPLFANLLRTIDPDWFSVIQLRSAQCLLTTWTRGSYLQILNVSVWAALALFLLKGRGRRFLAAIFAAGIAGLVCALVGGDLARNVFVVELQPWRSLWLLQLVSRLFIPMVLAGLLAKTSLAKRTDGLFALAVLFTIGVILMSSVAKLIRLPYSAEFNGYSILLTILALALIFVHLVLTAEKFRRIRLATLCLAVALVPVAALDWDLRTPWTKFVESPAPPPPDLAALLPANASLYWEGGPELAWFKLKRSSYFSCEQGTGIVFHRETAMTYKHRLDSFWPLRLDDLSDDDDCRNIDLTQKANRSRAGLEGVCKREPGLDYLALMTPVPGARSRTWKSPTQFQIIHLLDGKISGHSTDRFYFYDCRDFR